jgi:hypothetical protein
MPTWFIVVAVLVFGAGIYIGLGFPGLPGKEDRVLPPGFQRRRRREIQMLDWLRTRRR